jgi:putative ABC transport system ATP-binding protein
MHGLSALVVARPGSEPWGVQRDVLLPIAAPATPARVAGAAARVELRGVSKRYRVGDVTVTAIEDADLAVPASSFVVLLGPSGSGKTTLLNLIGALDTPSEGTVLIDGADISHASGAARFDVRRRSVSFIFQTFNLFPALTALENVQFGADVAGRRDPLQVAHTTLEQVGLANRRNHFPGQLSGGEQQRVAIARALATGNPIILADEPTGELDFRTGVQILQLLEAEAQAGKTVLVVTHNREISRAADRVVELSSGRIVADGPPAGGRAPIAELHW